MESAYTKGVEGACRKDGNAAEALEDVRAGH